jgi:hypothetical protein
VSTPEYERWTATAVRTPDQVRTEPGGPVPLTWQVEKLTEHTTRLSNAKLPADFPHEVERGDAGDALAVLALSESIRRDAGRWQAVEIREALRLGATWTQVAAAIDATPDQARAVLRQWADGQRKLWLGYEAEGAKPFGLDADEYAAVLALCDQPDGDNGRG